MEFTSVGCNEEPLMNYLEVCGQHSEDLGVKGPVRAAPNPCPMQGEQLSSCPHLQPCHLISTPQWSDPIQGWLAWGAWLVQSEGAHL